MPAVGLLSPAGGDAQSQRSRCAISGGILNIDILVLTQTSISEEQSNQLVCLRQTLLAEESENPFYRSFEGGMLSLSAFLQGEKDRVVYWGTSGERITTRYGFDSFSMSELLDSGNLLHQYPVNLLLQPLDFII